MDIFVYEVADAVIDMMGGSVEKALIFTRKDTMNRGRIYLLNDDGEKRSFDTVPDNAIALTFLTRAPLFVSEKLLTTTKQNSVFSEKSTPFLPKDDRKLMDLLRLRQVEELQSLSLDDLQRLINKALHLEDYQMANTLKTIIQNKGGMPS
jgi:bifunctional DNase/RNase